MADFSGNSPWTSISDLRQAYDDLVKYRARLEERIETIRERLEELGVAP